MTSKSAARSTENSKCDGFDYELDATVPLPTLPEWSKISAMAANDESFADQAMNEKIERLLFLVESIDEHLKKLAEAVIATNAEPPKARTRKKRASKKRASRKTAGQ
jgi:hypothetical protein